DLGADAERGGVPAVGVGGLGLHRDPEQPVGGRAVVDDVVGDALGVVDRDGEPDADRSAVGRGTGAGSGGGDRDVHPDDVPVDVHQRAAGVAVVDCRVGLD